MSSSVSPAPSRRKTLLSLGVLALLTGIVVFIFREHWAEISAALGQLTFWQAALGWRPTRTACCGICPQPTPWWQGSSWG